MPNKTKIEYINVTLSVKSRLKIELWDNKHQSLISTINFAMISIFDMALLSQYYRYQGYIFTECSLPYEWWLCIVKKIK